MWVLIPFGEALPDDLKDQGSRGGRDVEGRGPAAHRQPKDGVGPSLDRLGQPVALTSNEQDHRPAKVCVKAEVLTVG
jgi:hypothetical protein